MSVKITAVVAMDKNRVIGKDNALPWHIPEDLKFFKKTTMGHTIIMGRKSYESIGKPLPGRLNFVVSRSLKDVPESCNNVSYSKGSAAIDLNQEINIGPYLFDNIEDAVEQACEIAKRNEQNEVFIIGGAEIFEYCLPFIDKIYLTIIHSSYKGDVFFPKLKLREWTESARKEFHEEPGYSRITLDRKSS